MVDIAFVSSEMIILKLFGYFMARRPIRFVNGMLLKTQYDLRIRSDAQPATGVSGSDAEIQDQI